MCIYDNVALACLPENLFQHHHMVCAGCDQVLQNAARTHAGQLMDVTHQNQPRSHADCPKQGVHQVNIHHGHLINNNQVCLQRIFFIPLKSCLIPVLCRRPRQLQKPVDRQRLIPCRFRHPLCRTPGRRRQKNLHVFRFKITDDRIDGRGLSGSRTSGNDQKPVLHGLHHRTPLDRIQTDPGLFFHLLKLSEDLFFFNPALQLQVMEHLCRIQLHVIIPAVKHHRPLRIFFYDQFPVHAEIHHLDLRLRSLHVQKLSGPFQQNISRKAGMSFSGCLLEYIQKAASDPVIGIRMDPDPFCDLICCLKTDAGDVLRQTVWIFLHDLTGPLSVFLIDLHSQ